MANQNLKLKHIGPIQEVDIQFGDLTVLVGPQATGKSIFLQFLRLLLDTGPIFRTLRKHGLDWDGRVGRFLELYLGEGTKEIWQSQSSEIWWKANSIVSIRLHVRSEEPWKKEASSFRRSGF
jgi:predicted ATP-dependent endonuclease of OLD family